MFCAGHNPAKSTNFLFASNGNESIAGRKAKTASSMNRASRPPPPSGAVAVRLVIQPGRSSAFLNGLRLALSRPAFEPARRGADHRARRHLGQLFLGHQALRLFDAITARRTTLPDLAADAKAEALTVPRFRRNDPPVHALIAANGDILRGEIEAATNTSFGFRAGMEEFAVPRDRVKAVVWLGKPIDAPPPPPAQSPVQKFSIRR